MLSVLTLRKNAPVLSGDGIHEDPPCEQNFFLNIVTIGCLSYNASNVCSYRKLILETHKQLEHIYMHNDLKERSNTQ